MIKGVFERLESHWKRRHSTSIRALAAGRARSHLLTELGAVRRLADGLVGKVTKRVVAWVRSILGAALATAIIKKGRDITTVAHLGRHIPAERMTAMIVSGRECSIHHRLKTAGWILGPADPSPGNEDSTHPQRTGAPHDRRAHGA